MSGGLLVNEIEEVFGALFDNSKEYLDIVREIAMHRYGISKKKLSDNLKINRGGRISERLKQLEEAGFILYFLPYGRKRKGYYRVIDEYTTFYFKWIEPQAQSLQRLGKSKDYWINQSQTCSFKSWAGYAFESICYKHIDKIANRLSLKLSSFPSSWQYIPKNGDQSSKGTQIDLLFDRIDDAITLCEIKYSDKPFVIDKEYSSKLMIKKEIFKKETGTEKQLFLVMVSTYGVKENPYSDVLIDGQVIADDFF